MKDMKGSGMKGKMTGPSTGIPNIKLTDEKSKCDYIPMAGDKKHNPGKY